MISLDIPICGWEHIFGKLMDDLEVWEILFLRKHIIFDWPSWLWLGISNLAGNFGGAIFAFCSFELG